MKRKKVVSLPTNVKHKGQADSIENTAVQVN